MQLPAPSMAVPAWRVLGPAQSPGEGGCVQLGVLSQKAKVWLWGSVPEAQQGLASADGARAARMKVGKQGLPGGWSLLCWQHKASKAGSSLSAWHL